MTTVMDRPPQDGAAAALTTDPGFGRIRQAPAGRLPAWNDALHRELLEHSWLIYRGVELRNSEELLNYGSAAGEPLTYAFGQIFELKAAGTKDGKTQLSDRAMSIHQDSVLPEEFADLVMMYVWSAPATGGESLLCDNRKFLTLLEQRDPELYAFFIHARVLYKNHTGNYYAGTDMVDWINKPTMRKHPLLGTMTPFFAFNPLGDPDCNFTARFEGLSIEDSDDKMRRLDALMRSPEVMVQHVLHPGDVIIFDNLLVSHGRNAFNTVGQPRHLSRVQIGLREPLALAS
ncbi:TauD/TfdA family dioxygenase [Oxalobacteraceae bacterium]|nr:TauD/TfdA family dioxygenase [Oxalobacteraceae bacterium]